MIIKLEYYSQLDTSIIKVRSKEAIALTKDNAAKWLSRFVVKPYSSRVM
jgi:hypothetical protein